MPDLSFRVDGAEPEPYAVAPTLMFKLGVANADPAETIHTVNLRCQIQIEVTKRRYSDAEQGQLVDLFGEPARWGETLRTMLWTHTNAVVPQFNGSATVDLPVPCSYDFNVAATKYFAGLETGEVPLCLQFSGTVFYASRIGALQIAQIPWTKEAQFRMPVDVWREMMEVYYPNTAWLSLRRDVFDRLHRYKMRHAIPTWEQTVERLLARDEEEPS